VSAAQHAGVSRERWRGYPRGQQILMIANEMNRASKLFGEADGERLRLCYERVLAPSCSSIPRPGGSCRT